MVIKGRICPFGLKKKEILRRRRYHVEDHQSYTSDEVDDFKYQYGVKTTPQAFLQGKRVGGFDGACHQLCSIGFPVDWACCGMVHRIFDVRVGDAQASERRELLELVGELSPSR